MMRPPLSVCLAAAAICTGAAPADANVVISNNATQHMTCSAGVCAPTAVDAVLNVQDLEAMLASGSVTVTTTGSGVLANNIALDARLEWSTTNRLTLDAFQSVRLNRTLSVIGAGAVAIITDDGGSGKGEFWCGDKGRLRFRNLDGTLTINGTAYTLVGSVGGLAAAITANPAGAFALAKDYDAARDGTYSSAPIPASTFFDGMFDGLGNTISNLSINDPVGDHSVALFGELDDGSIANVRLANVNVQGGVSGRIGGLVGYSQGGSITHSFTSGTVSGVGGALVGGLIGSSVTPVAGSGSSAKVSLSARASVLWRGSAGGLIGFNGARPITDSHATGTVSGSGSVGGLVGTNYDARISHSWASGSVSGTDGSTYAGGLVGSHGSGLIERSFATGPVSCAYICGGLVGVAESYTDGWSRISESFATGSVTADIHATTWVGGLVGSSNIAKVANSYATGAVSAKSAGGLIGQNDHYFRFHSISNSYATGAVRGAPGSAGGLIGLDNNLQASTIKQSYWDVTTSRITDPGQGAGNVANDPGIKGLRNEQLKSALPKGFASTIWAQDKKLNGGLPYLIANPPQN